MMATVATPIYAGGARRSAAPTYSPRTNLGTAAINYDEGLTSELMSNFNMSPQPMQAPQATSASLVNQPMFGETAGNVGQAAQLAAVLNRATAAPGQAPTVDLGGAEKYLGPAAGLLSARSGEDLAWMGGGQLLANEIPGVGPYIGSLRALSEGNLEGAVGSGIDAYLYGINPVLGAVNSVAQMFGMDGIGEAVYDVGSDIWDAGGDFLTDLPIVGGVLEDIGDTIADFFGW